MGELFSGFILGVIFSLAVVSAGIAFLMFRGYYLEQKNRDRS